ncbi:hypothetical protein JCM8547_005730 [Rhodosporidiobolus lusitaniae]
MASLAFIALTGLVGFVLGYLIKQFASPRFLVRPAPPRSIRNADPPARAAPPSLPFAECRPCEPAKLPSDLMTKVLEHFIWFDEYDTAREALSACCLVSKRFLSLARPLLQRHDEEHIKVKLTSEYHEVNGVVVFHQHRPSDAFAIKNVEKQERIRSLEFETEDWQSFRWGSWDATLSSRLAALLEDLDGEISIVLPSAPAAMRDTSQVDTLFPLYDPLFEPCQWLTALSIWKMDADDLRGLNHFPHLRSLSIDEFTRGDIPAKVYHKESTGPAFLLVVFAPTLTSVTYALDGVTSTPIDLSLLSSLEHLTLDLNVAGWTKTAIVDCLATMHDSVPTSSPFRLTIKPYWPSENWTQKFSAFRTRQGYTYATSVFRDPRFERIRALDGTAVGLGFEVRE